MASLREQMLEEAHARELAKVGVVVTEIQKLKLEKDDIIVFKFKDYLKESALVSMDRALRRNGITNRVIYLENGASLEIVKEQKPDA